MNAERREFEKIHERNRQFNDTPNHEYKKPSFIFGIEFNDSNTGYSGMKANSVRINTNNQEVIPVTSKRKATTSFSSVSEIVTLKIK